MTQKVKKERPLKDEWKKVLQLAGNSDKRSVRFETTLC